MTRQGYFKGIAGYNSKDTELMKVAYLIKTEITFAAGELALQR
jgi:hypothetical protein